MSKVILDAVLREKLKNLTEPLDLCDESGRVLARVIPEADPVFHRNLGPQISREEMRWRKANKGLTYTTAEVLDQLRGL